MTQFHTLEDVLSELQNNYEFKEEFKKNPAEALRKANLSLSEEDLKKIQQFNTVDGELDKRINR